MVLQIAQRVPVELGVPDDDAILTDEGNAPPEGTPGTIGEGVRVIRFTDPEVADELGLAREKGRGIVAKSRRPIGTPSER